MGLGPIEPVCPWALATHRGITVWAPGDLGMESDDLAQLTEVDPDSWSGLTVRHGELVGIVLNSAHPRSRQTNTLMHEISHLDLRHVPSRIEVSDGGLLLLSDYPQELEDEANWLAGAVLLPRNALLFHRGRGSSVVEIASEYGVSDQLCTWRLNMTGVDRQLGVGRRSPFD